MKSEKFVIEEALMFGWRTMTGKFGTLFKFVILPVIANLILQVGMRFALGLNDKNFSLEALPLIKLAVYTIIQFFLNAVLSLGMIRVGLKLVDDQQPEFSDYSTPL